MELSHSRVIAALLTGLAEGSASNEVKQASWIGAISLHFACKWYASEARPRNNAIRPPLEREGFFADHVFERMRGAVSRRAA
jgi:hypothetical protein